ncbi:MAG: hypothetical protein ACHQHN_12900 [Sphingobacteriales bacterium]
MENEFDAIMVQRTDAELIAILNGPKENYQSAAMEAAQRVFNKRNLSQEQIIVAEHEIETIRLKDDAKANEPLGVVYKIWAFIFPGIFLIIFSGTFNADGYDRKAKELRRWNLYGFGFYVGLILLLFIFFYFSS